LNRQVPIGRSFPATSNDKRRAAIRKRPYYQPVTHSGFDTPFSARVVTSRSFEADGEQRDIIAEAVRTTRGQHLFDHGFWF
jgi:hypothetical protein